MRCVTCKNDYSNLPNHIQRSSCSYPKISPPNRKVIEGVVLGDGHIADGRKNDYLIVKNTNKRFLEHLSKMPFMKEVRLFNTDKNSNYGGKPVYSVKSIAMPEMNALRDKWYPKGKKKMPESIELSSKTLKYWYVCDGGLRWDENNVVIPKVEISNYSMELNNAIDSLKKKGLSPKRVNSGIQFPAKETGDFMDYIGEPVPGFDYKWATKSRQNYKKLKGENYGKIQSN